MRKRKKIVKRRKEMKEGDTNEDPLVEVIPPEVEELVPPPEVVGVPVPDVAAPVIVKVTDPWFPKRGEAVILIDPTPFTSTGVLATPLLFVTDTGLMMVAEPLAKVK